jgi:hypothetical protein
MKKVALLRSPFLHFLFISYIMKSTNYLAGISLLSRLKCHDPIPTRIGQYAIRILL